MKYLTNEMQLLIELARPNYSEVSPQAKSLLGKINWDEFVSMAMRHKVLLVIERNLELIAKNNLSVQIPYTSIARIRMLAKMSLNRIEALNNTISYLLQNILSYNIKVVLIKGPSLNYIYPHKNLRSYGDIDLLIGMEDIEKVHNLLLKNGYAYEGGISIKSNLVKKISMQTINCIGNYIKQNDINRINIDLHKADEHNAWNLMDFYNNARKDNAEYFSLDSIDSFIFVCFHAWHHYPRVVSVRLEAVQATLRDYMEIRELYLYIQRKGWLNVLYDRIIYINCGAIVNNMLYLTERLYNAFCERNEVITCLPTVENDYEASALTSYFERRLFYPNIEKELLDKYMALRLIPHSSKSFIEAALFDFTKNHYYNDNVFWDAVPIYHSEKEIFYDEPYGTSIIKNIDCKFCFSIGWNEKDLILKIEIYSMDLNWGKENDYNPMQDCVKFIFDDDWSKVFILQIKETGSHEMFIARENIYPLEKIESNKTFYNKQNECHSIITNIPWKYTHLKPEIGKEFFFYFNIICWNREMRYSDAIIFNDHENRLVKLCACPDLPL